MRILVLGANGQVGTELLQRLQSRLGATVIAATRSGSINSEPCEAADFSAPDSLRAVIARVRPDAVVNAAAYTAVDKAETEQDIAFAVNATAPGVIAASCAELGIPLVHYSTDYVFAGDASAPYVPDSVTGPSGVYGASKLAGEHAVADAGGDALILRTAWVYALHGSNFLRTMLRLADRPELGVVDDQVGSPTPAWLIAEVTAAALKKGFRGVQRHHVVTEGQTSWAGFADAIFDEALARGIISARPAVNRIRTEQYPTPAKRPAYSVLSGATLSAATGVHLPKWRDALNMTFDDNAESQAESIR